MIKTTKYQGGVKGWTASADNRGAVFVAHSREKGIRFALNLDQATLA